MYVQICIDIGLYQYMHVWLHTCGNIHMYNASVHIQHIYTRTHMHVDTHMYHVTCIVTHVKVWV